jgi:hypothetical protein
MSWCKKKWLYVHSTGVIATVKKFKICKIPVKENQAKTFYRWTPVSVPVFKTGIVSSRVL